LFVLIYWKYEKKQKQDYWSLVFIFTCIYYCWTCNTLLPVCDTLIIYWILNSVDIWQLNLELLKPMNAN